MTANAPASDRRLLVSAAAARWRRHLSDLGGPNTLLWHHDQRGGSLDLTTAHPGGVSKLLKGARTRLSEIVREPGAHAEALVVARAIHAKSQELLDERGLATGFLAIGAATWDAGRGEPKANAPVLLRPCHLRPTGAAHDDFDLDLGPEADFNPVLAHYLSTVAGIPLDPEELGRRAIVATGFDPYPVYAALGRLCSGMPGFAVTPRLVVSTYPFGKFAMVADVAAREASLAGNDLVAALAGDDLARQRLRVTLSEPPGDPDPVLDRIVLDADPAQASVVDAALAGTNLVASGPTGSGRTQTAANLVAALAGEGKTVLLVSRHRETLRTVAARLDSVGLGHLVLDTTGNAVDRRPLLDSVQAALERLSALPPAAATSAGAGEESAVVTDEPVVDLERLRSRRTALVEHVDALHEMRDPWGVSVHEIQWAMAELERRTPAPASRVLLDAALLERLSRTRIGDLARDLTQAVEGGAWVTGPEPDPWFGARITSPEEVERARDIVTRLSGPQLSETTAHLDEILADSSLPPGGTIADIGRALATMHGVRDTLEVFRPEVFDLPLDEEVAATATHTWRRENGVSMGWLRRWRMRRAARTLLRPGRPPHDLHAELASARDQRSAWIALAGAGGRPEISGRLDEADTPYAELAEQLDWLSTRLADTAGGGDLRRMPVERLRARFAELAAAPDRLEVLPAVTPVLDELADTGFGDVVADLARRRVEAAQVEPEMEHIWWASLARIIAERDPRYGQHDGVRLRRAVTESRTLDVEHLAHVAAQVREGTDRRARGRAATHPQLLAALRAEVAKEHRLTPLRELLTRVGPLVGALHPCLAVSPLAVGQLVPEDAEFDVVVIDDADGVCTAEAVSALSRARQVVALGDLDGPRPAPFTTTAIPTGEPGAEPSGSEGADDQATPASSLLHDLAALLPIRRLDWRHAPIDERLAGPVTQVELDGTLTTLPGPVVASPVHFQQVAGIAPVAPGNEEAIDSTPGEVAAVADLVMEHGRRHPEQSLAVVTLSRRHADLVKNAVRDRIREAERAGGAARVAFASDERPERFVVVPLERAAGITRDAVLLAVGYGRTPHGRVLHRFPDLAVPGADRMLVAASCSARVSLTVVSSLTAEELDPERMHTPGAMALRELLDYAQGQASPADGDATSLQDPLMSDLAERLRREGYRVRERLGRGRHGIEIAVGHRRHPGRYLVAVESDGIGYAAVPGSRARDRLRVEQLERMGWRQVRIWSTDLYRDPAREVARVAGAVRSALGAAEAPRPVPGQTARGQAATAEAEEESGHEQWLREQRPPHWE